MKINIKRDLFDEVAGHLSMPEISLIVGPRQSGKTTLLRLLQQHLQSMNKKVLFLNLDVERDAQYFLSQELLLKKIHLEFGNEHGFVFIDEIQRKLNAGLFLKGIYDQNLPIKFVVTGSGSLELKESIHESLAGRKRLFELPTVSFAEFVQYQTNYRFAANLTEFFRVETSTWLPLLDEYLNWGGYPAVLLVTGLADKQKILSEIISSYLDRDIRQLLQLERPESFVRMVKTLAAQSGKLLNLTELGSLVGLSQPTLKKYLWYAEKTFVIQSVMPYYTNLGKEIIKSPVIYFADLGFRNYLLGLTSAAEHPAEAGFLFQNLVLNILRAKIRWTGSSIKYWRTTDGAEVDFILDTNRTVIPVEVKYRQMARPEVPRSMRSFIAKYQPEQAWIINLNFAAEQRIDSTRILFKPFFMLLGGQE